jgi:hypothetical protein
MSFHVRCPQDFEPVEAHIAAAMRCEPGRCAYLRSSQFLGFRVRALYRAPDGDFSACTPDGLLLQFISGGQDAGAGGLVTVRRYSFEPEYDSTWGPEQEALSD